MNNKQLYLLWGTIIAFILIVLFPPMDVTVRSMSGKTNPARQGLIEWRFIFADGARTEKLVVVGYRGADDYKITRVYVANHIKVAAWAIEFVVLGVVAGGLWFTFQRKG